MTEPHRILYRSETDRVFGGVAGGLGHYFQIDPVIFRLIFIILAFAGGTGFILYLLCWVVIPSEHKPDKTADFKENIKAHTEEIAQDFERNWGKYRSERRSVIGAFFVLIGILFLLVNFSVFSLDAVFRLWPILLILLGILLFTRNRRN